MFLDYGTDPTFVRIERDLSPEEMAAIALAAGADDADCTTDYDAEVTARKACESDEEWSEAARLGAIRLAKRVFSLRCSACGTLTCACPLCGSLCGQDCESHDFDAAYVPAEEVQP